MPLQIVRIASPLPSFHQCGSLFEQSAFWCDILSKCWFAYELFGDSTQNAFEVFMQIMMFVTHNDVSSNHAMFL